MILRVTFESELKTAHGYRRDGTEVQKLFVKLFLYRKERKRGN